ncbi:hypothetical protein BCR33DRAFT_315302 [Rhizoclosmatium globosum]|uniref:Uncharacterized protein n=1 Tax=Rhizoclosmatium globosum TaxID=329046 RepID=A0A1Y2CZ68_9FUNG|nr:hypothetical protein BCR33DRAFT_315302 [Rhizoclosmatium globosum]|eukprot:ORY52333.1 hypothetical protein BCR33DRAFT_315302 [Rhizoclosmatium globosum]
MVADVEDKTESVEETAGTTLSDPSSFNVPSVVELSATDDLIPESVVTAVTAAPVVDVVVDVVVVVEDEIQQQVLEADEDDVLVVESAVSASGFDLEVVKDDVDVAGDEEKKDVVETQVVEVQDPSKSVESSSVEEVVVAVVDVEEVMRRLLRRTLSKRQFNCQNTLKLLQKRTSV